MTTYEPISSPDHQYAVLKIQQGTNYFCASYQKCILPQCNHEEIFEQPKLKNLPRITYQNSLKRQGCEKQGKTKELATI